MTLYFYDDGSGGGPKLLFVRRSGGRLLVAKSEACCCARGSCGCATLPETLYARLRRSGGDWSDCGAGQWADNQTFTLTETADGDTLCEGENARKWAGTIDCGDEIAICCDPDDDVITETGADSTWWVWWCGDTANSQVNTDIPCEDGEFTLDWDVMTGGACCCTIGAFELDIRTTPFP